MLIYGMLLAFLTAVSAYPARICTDTRPVDLLGEALSEKTSFPAGTEIVMLDGIKGYRFDAQAITFGVDSKNVFARCKSLPPEFSVQINYKHSASRNMYEYLLALLAQDRKTVLFSMRLRSDSLLLEYVRKGDRRLQAVKFANDLLTDGGWHNLVLSIAEDEAKLTVDCDQYTKKLDLPMEPGLDVTNTRFHIGSRRKKRRRFTGTLRQVVFLPGADASNLICPSPYPSLAAVRQRLPARSLGESGASLLIFEEEQPYVTCSIRHKGRLLLASDSTLKVCTGDDFKQIKSNPARMDYIVDYEDVQTSNSTIDVEVFHIPESGHFLATANRGGGRKSTSDIFKWNGVKYVPYQKLPSKEAQHWKHFTIGDEHFLALANSGRGKQNNVRSVIFRWLRRKKKFVRHQLLPTYSARSWEAFVINDRHYLAVANYMDDSNNTYNLSEVFVWDADIRIFLPFQKLASVGAVDVEFFKIEFTTTYNFLVIANTFDGQTTRLNSTIFVWERGRFRFFQNIQTTGAADWESFEIDGRHYLAVANTFLFDSKISIERDYHISSSIYELNFFFQRFEKIQDLLTHGAKDWEYFTVGANSYLIISNLEKAPGDNSVRSVIYRWQGVEKFVPVHNFTSTASADFEYVKVNGDEYLAMANPDWIFSKVFKIVTY